MSFDQEIRGHRLLLDTTAQLAESTDPYILTRELHPVNGVGNTERSECRVSKREVHALRRQRAGEAPPGAVVGTCTSRSRPTSPEEGRSSSSAFALPGMKSLAVAGETNWSRSFFSDWPISSDGAPSIVWRREMIWEVLAWVMSVMVGAEGGSLTRAEMMGGASAACCRTPSRSS